MKLCKRFCAAVIAVLLVSGGSCAVPVLSSVAEITAQAEEAEIWDGSADTSWYDAEEATLHISTAEELAGLAQIVNGGKNMKGQTIYLEKDITLNDISYYAKWNETAPANKWVSVGTDKIKFEGTFDARNHTITGMYTDYGLFHSATDTIKNVKLVSAYAVTSAVCYDSSGTIDNCHAEAVIYNSSGDAGGICCSNSGTISNCTMAGSVEGTYAGGICCSNKSTKTTITKCENSASVTATKSYAGGIAAFSNPDYAVISDSYNTGTITGGIYAGGILGYATTPSTTTSSFVTTDIINSYNTGAVTGTDSAGGILGGYASYSLSSDTVNIKNSYNTGKITGMVNTGGILGYAYSSVSSLTLDISNSYNTGTVTETVHAGGILGYASSSSSAASSLNAIISNAYNTGIITGKNNAGGILGYVSSSSTVTVDISNAYNTGAVTGTYSAGSIVGYAYAVSSFSSLTVDISNAYNAGKLSGTTTGGIIGKNEKNGNNAKLTSTMSACYYLNTTAVKGIGSETTDNAISKSDANMKKETFAKDLGDAFVYVKGSYPKLAWETTEEPTETIQPSSEPATEEPSESTEPTETTSKPQKQTIKLTEYSETATLSVNYDGDIIWLSSNENVAAVKDGVVTAVGNGTATVYALCGEQRIETQVEVAYDYYLNPTEITLEAGAQTQLEFHSANNKEIYNQIAEWSSSNEKVAKVDNEGIITALSAGIAVITAKAGDVSVTCDIIVTTSAEPAISAKSTTIKTGEEKGLTISNYSGSVTWVSSDTKIVTISPDGILKGIKAGTAVIYAMLENGKTISTKITVVNNEILSGDVNLDGSVDILDVITVNKAVLGKETLTAEQIKAADVSKNDVPDATDSLMILKYIVGILESLG